MEHEYRHSLIEGDLGHRRLIEDEEGLTLDFTTQINACNAFHPLSCVVDDKPKVIEVTPEVSHELHENTLVSIVFDTPVVAGTGIVYIGNSVSVTSTPVTLTSVEGLVASFVVPPMVGGRVYLHVPAGAVRSSENDEGNEEYRFNSNFFWTFVEGSFIEPF